MRVFGGALVVEEERVAVVVEGLGEGGLGLVVGVDEDPLLRWRVVVLGGLFACLALFCLLLLLGRLLVVRLALLSCFHCLLQHRMLLALEAVVRVLMLRRQSTDLPSCSHSLIPH